MSHDYCKIIKRIVKGFGEHIWIVALQSSFQIAVYRGVLSLYFSFRGERKVPKEPPLKGVTHGASLKKPTT
jgi:hypothetical protein